MLWALTVTICLADGASVECRDWRVEPFQTKYECQVALRETKDELAGTDVQHLHLDCERGNYS